MCSSNPVFNRSGRSNSEVLQRFETIASCLQMQLSEVCSGHWSRLVAQVHSQEIRQRPTVQRFQRKSLWVVRFFRNVEALRVRQGLRLGSTWRVVSFPVAFAAFRLKHRRDMLYMEKFPGYWYPLAPSFRIRGSVSAQKPPIRYPQTQSQSFEIGVLGLRIPDCLLNATWKVPEAIFYHVDALRYEEVEGHISKVSTNPQ